MLEEVKSELAMEILGQDLPVDNLRELFDRVNKAAGPAEVLGCLVAFREQGLSIDAVLDRLSAEDRAGLMPTNRVDLVAGMLTSLLDKLDSDQLAELFDQASLPGDVRTLVNLLVSLQKHGVELGEVKFESGEKDCVDEGQHSPDVFMSIDGLIPTPPDLECPQPGQKKGEVRKAHKKPGLYGMKPPESHGFFHNSPQKDFVRQIWGARLEADFESGFFGDLKPEDASIVSLMGEDARELPIYEKLRFSPANIFSPEFSRRIYERMKGKVSFNVFPGNLYDFTAHLFTNDQGRRFSAANIDLCSTAEEFFASGDHFILDWLAGNSEFMINTRVRQDYVGIDSGSQMMIEVFEMFPEIKIYFEKILEVKMKLFPDPVVAKNMAIRQMYFLHRMATGFYTMPMDCCAGSIRQISRWCRNWAYIVNYLNKNGFPQEWGENKVDRQIMLYRKIFSNNLADTLEKFSNGEMREYGRNVVRIMSARKRTIGIPDERSLGLPNGSREAKRAEFLEVLGLTRGAVNAVSALFDDEEIDRSDPRYKEIEENVRQFEGLSLAVMTRLYTRRKITDLSCVTYGHGSQNTFQTWMMRFEVSKKPISVLDWYKQALDLLLNSEEIFVDSRMNIHRHKPEGEVVVPVAKKRITDWHRDYSSKLKKGGSTSRGIHLSREERERRKRKRKIQSESRKASRAR